MKERKQSNLHCKLSELPTLTKDYFLAYTQEETLLQALREVKNINTSDVISFTYIDSPLLIYDDEKEKPLVYHKLTLNYYETLDLLELLITTRNKMKGIEE